MQHPVEAYADAVNHLIAAHGFSYVFVGSDDPTVMGLLRPLLHRPVASGFKRAPLAVAEVPHRYFKILSLPPAAFEKATHKFNYGALTIHRYQGRSEGGGGVPPYDEFIAMMAQTHVTQDHGTRSRPSRSVIVLYLC